MQVAIRCQRNEIILMTSAVYGRMNVGRCIRKPDEFMGCSNDVLPLLDKWCSGRRECTIGVPNEELEKMNTECLEILIKYLEVEHICLKGKLLIQTMRLVISLSFSRMYVCVCVCVCVCVPID